MATQGSGSCTHGVRLREARVGELTLTEATYAPGSWLPPHTHDHASMVLLRDGRYRERVGRADEDMLPGMVYVRERGLVHSNMFGTTGARCLFIDGIDAMIADMDGGAFGHGYRRFSTGAIAHVGERLAATTWHDDAASRLVIHGIVHELLGVMTCTSRSVRSRAPRWVLSARDRLHAEAYDPPAIGMLAREAGVHPSHFIRSFKRHVGVRPGQFVHQARVDHACRLLADPSLTLSEVASMTGFADQSHFGRIFLRITGKTPARWRKATSPERA